MPSTRYKIWKIGSPVGVGATDSKYVGVNGVAKGKSDNLPYVVINELICSYLAKILLLPIPPGFLIEDEGNELFVSLNFNISGRDLPPADPKEVVYANPQLSWGIILFDIWVVNGDRHPRNIMFDESTGKIFIFDHSHAFYGADKGKLHLENNANQLGADGHCLMKEIFTADYADEWIEKIMAIPEYYIRGVVSSAKEVGLPEEEIDFCANYLLQRRKKLLQLIKNDKIKFPKIDAWPIFFNDPEEIS